MHRSTSILVVLLGASLLANAMLAVRLSRAADLEPSTGRKAPAAAERAAKPAESASLQESLDQERKKNEELRARIERLETDKKVLAQDGPGAGAPDKLAAFRTKLRKLVKLMKDPAAKSGAIDPDSMVELTDTMMEFFKMSAMRTKEPKMYADYVQAFYEVGLEGEGTALSEAQTSTLARVFQEFGEELAKIPPTPTGNRLVKEIELEGAVMNRVTALLTEPQRAAISKDNMNVLAMGNMMSTSYVPQTGGVDMIAKQWSQFYQLDAAQLPQAKVAAQAYLDAMGRVDAKGFALEKQGTPESYEYRLRSAREQLAALTMLQASMTPAQQERLRTQAMREILLMDGKGFQAPAPTEK